ncbi:MAG: hypothetical protein ACJA1C_000924 [Crocinitomicaceae bacterium]|jgi:hypothetical protein
MESEQIKKIVESCHLNFLIGSGASRPFLGTLGAIEDLLTDLAKKESSNEKTLVDASIKKYYYDVAIRGNIEIASGTDGKLEATKKNYSDFFQALSTIVHKRAGNLVSKQVNVFTTNMDLFLENSLEDESLHYNDGFTGRLSPRFGTDNFHNSIRKTSTHYEIESEVALFNIFKLHGSLNWKQNEDTIVYDSDLSILKAINEVPQEPENYLEIEYQDADEKWQTHTITELYQQIADKGLEKTDDHDRFIVEYNNLLMINPTKEKFETTTRNLTFYELLRMYSNHLERENSVLIVFGFSFADEHIREITKRVADSNPTLLVVIFAFDLEAKEAISQHFPERLNIKIIADPDDVKKYSLDQINADVFTHLANDLSNQ